MSVETMSLTGDDVRESSTIDITVTAGGETATPWLYVRRVGNIVVIDIYRADEGLMLSLDEARVVRDAIDRALETSG